MNVEFPVHHEQKKGFEEHCKVAALIIREMGVNSHTKHHIRTAIREATHKLTDKKGCRKSTAHFISESARQQMENGNKEKLVLEHVIPISYINELVLNLANTRQLTWQDVASIVLDWTCLALITEEEDGRLPKKAVPPDIQTNKFSRYEHVDPPIRLQPNIYKDLNRQLKEMAR